MRHKIIFIVLCSMLLANFAQGYEVSSPSDSSNAMDAVNSITSPLTSAAKSALSPNTLINALNKVNWYGIFDFSGTSLNTPSTTPSTNLNLQQFFTPSNVSTNDALSAGKAVLILIIQIFLAVISVIGGILKVILSLL